MSVMIRLRRSGTKKKPYYRIVALDKRKKPQGGYLDKIGLYNPLADPEEIVIDKDKLQKWLDNGASCSNTVSSLIKRHDKAGTGQSDEKKVVEEKPETQPEKREAPAEEKAAEKPAEQQTEQPAE